MLVAGSFDERVLSLAEEVGESAQFGE